MTLYGDFLDEHHRRTHKWYQYFPVYETHFERFRNRHSTIFEIGVGEGGSLQQWKRYLGPFAVIVGLDIHPRCKQIEEEQIHVRIGSQNDVDFLAKIVAEFGAPDIVIDDGSHLQPHVNTTFEYLYPLVAKNGIYVVEDLHAAYWPDHGGGLHHAGSFIETAKGYIDKMHADYIGGDSIRTPTGDRTTSIHFYDSIVVFEVGERRVMGNRVTGDPALFRNEWVPPGETAESFTLAIENTLQSMDKPGPDQVPSRVNDEPLHEPREAKRDHGGTLETQIAALRASTSWRITLPLRAVGKLFRKSRSR